MWRCMQPSGLRGACGPGRKRRYRPRQDDDLPGRRLDRERLGHRARELDLHLHARLEVVERRWLSAPCRPCLKILVALVTLTIALSYSVSLSFLPSMRMVPRIPAFLLVLVGRGDRSGHAADRDFLLLGDRREGRKPGPPGR